MIGLGLRLTLNGGKEAAVRLLIAAAAVALGVSLLLVALAGMNAINAQNGRTAWLNTPYFANGPGVGPGPKGAVVGPPTSSTSDVAPLWAAFNTDYFKSHTIYRVDVAATGPSSPIPPGISRLPGPGQFYASPALERLLRSTPATELGARFPGKQIGSIGPSALPSPTSLIIIIGHTAPELSKVPGASQVTEFNTATGHSGGSLGWDSNRLQIILAVGALALLFPVLMFIATATRLSAARREQRFAAMRLVGATPRQVSLIAAVEASVAALVGVAVGFGLFFAFRPLVTNVPFTGQAFAPGDLSLSPTDILLVAVGVPIAAALAARVALRRVVISPLGVSRRVTPPPPRAYRLVPLVAGIAELSYFVEVGRPKSTGGQIDAYFGGCLLIMVGLIVAGPWLTMVGSRVMARRTSRTSVLIAGRRMSDNPRGAFRAISGLILALFVGSVSVGIIGTILDDQGTTGGGTVARETLVAQFGPLENQGPLPAGEPTTASVPRQLRHGAPRDPRHSWRHACPRRRRAGRRKRPDPGFVRAARGHPERRSLRAGSCSRHHYRESRQCGVEHFDAGHEGVARRCHLGRAVGSASGAGDDRPVDRIDRGHRSRAHRDRSRDAERADARNARRDQRHDQRAA